MLGRAMVGQFDPSERLPEFRELIHQARQYIAGEIHFSYVCSAADSFYHAAKYYVTDKRLKKMSEEWADMSLRVWPEIARIDNPITEPEFKQWVQDQLAVFEPIGT